MPRLIPLLLFFLIRTTNSTLFYILIQRRRGLLRKCIFLVRVQAAITCFQTFYWSSKTASPQLIQWTVRINRFWQLWSVHKIHIHLEATSPLYSILFWPKKIKCTRLAVHCSHFLVPKINLSPRVIITSCYVNYFLRSLQVYCVYSERWDVWV